MYAVTARMVCDEPATAESAEQMRRVVRAAALPADGLEHLYVQPTTRGADLVMFLIAADLETAESVAARLIQRIREAGLASCRAVTCQVELIVPFAEAALRPDPPLG